MTAVAVSAQTPDGVVATFVGVKTTPGTADGTRDSARFNECSSGPRILPSCIRGLVRRRCHQQRHSTGDGGWRRHNLRGQQGNTRVADGTGSSASFWVPNGIAFNAAGDLFVPLRI